MVALMNPRRLISIFISLISIAIFSYPVAKMTITALDNDVNLNPIFMVLGSIAIAFLISKIKR